MYKKSVFAIVLLLSLVAMPTAVFGDSLVAHWKLDESSGTTAADSSGNGNPGTLYNWDGGDVSWLGGKIGNALNFDGVDSYVQVDDDPAISFGTGSFTLSLWIKTDNFGTRRILQKGTSADPGGRRYTIPYQQYKVYFDIDDGVTKTNLNSTSNWNGPWVHVAAVRDRATDRIYLYRDGQEDCSTTDNTNGSIDKPVPLMIGLDELGSAAECFKGAMDDIRFYDFALTQPQIESIYNLEDETISNPDPQDEETGVSITKDLSWDAGWMESKYDVYLGTDEGAVTDANTTNDPCNVYKARITSATYDPGTLSPETQYYWRIDGLDGSNNVLFKGPVWQFTTASLKASAPFPMDEAVSLPQDLSLAWVAGAAAVSHDVYFGSDEDNVTAAGRLLADINGDGPVSYPDIAVIAEQWLTSPGGADPLADLDGNGDVNFVDYALFADDWLEPPDPEFKGNQPVENTTYDLPTLSAETTYYWRIDEVNGGGEVVEGDVWEFTTMAASELDPNLMAHWKFDETYGTSAADSSGNENTGTLYNMTDSDWIEGKIGNALDFDGSDDYVQVADHSSISFGTGSFSIAFWIKDDVFDGDGEILINGSSGGSGETGNRYEIGNTNSYGGSTTGAMVFVIDHNSTNDKKVINSSPETFVTGEWVHCVCIRNAANQKLYIYKNGQEVKNVIGHAKDIDSPFEPLYIAQDEDGGQRFEGQLDDIRFYDYVLLQNEIDALYRVNVNLAWDPDPADGAGNISTTPTLSWLQGENAASHDVYLGSSEVAVSSATNAPDPNGDISGDGRADWFDVKLLSEQWLGSVGDPSADLDDNGEVDFNDYAILAADWQKSSDLEFKGNQEWADNTYNPSTLVENTTYYWRIDEVNDTEPDSPYTGNIWSFTTVSSSSAPLGTIIVDPTNSARMVYNDTYENGRLKPVCFAGPGDPEDFFYNDTAANLSLLTSRGARCTYITAVLQDFGGGNPGTGAALDAKLDEWEGYITTLENAGIITVFFFFDDTQGLTANWQELVDKCVAKFKHHELLIWSVAEEYGEALTTTQVSQVAARIKSQDDNNHVVGVHQNSGNSFDFLGDSNLDMFLMQLNYSTPGDLHNQVKNSNANGTKILNMAEASDHAKQTRTAVRQWNWASVMGGASAVQVLWMGRATDPADWNTQDKYDDCARLMDFMESTLINQTSCRDDLARGNTDYVLADPGNVYIVYGDAGTSLGVNILAGTYFVKWFDPVDGDWVDEGSQVLTAGDKTFTKPGAIGSEAALYLELDDGWSYSVETEDYDTQVGSGWSLNTSTSGYSGSGYMQTTASGTLEYDISFPAAGTYYCYIRNWASDHLNNGCHLEFDSVRLSEQSGRVGVYAVKQSIWNWATQWQFGDDSHIGPLDIVVGSAGTHTLGIVTREIGFKADRIIIIDSKIGGQDYTGTTAPAFLDELDTIPNGYN